MDSQKPESGRAELSDIAKSPHGVVVEVTDLGEARAMIEALEDRGVPTNSIELVGAQTKDPRRDNRESDVAESEAFTNVSRSTIVGGAIGTLLGGALGLLMAYLIPDLTWYWGLVIGGLFGAGVGGAAGGISVAKYSSPAWDETYQVEPQAGIRVAVHHLERGIVDTAAEVMSSRGEFRPTRFDNTP